jgi:hypothetical protein
MINMSVLTKLYIDFKGWIPDMDGVRDCDWYIKIEGDPVTDEMLTALEEYVGTLVKKINDEEDVLDYYSMTYDAEQFMIQNYGYTSYDDPAIIKSIKVNTDEDT